MTTSNRSNIGRAKVYWEGIRRDRPMPSRADLDPTEIAPILPNVLLIDVLRDPLDFRFRLVGTRIEEIIAGPYTGVRFSELSHMRQGSKIWAEFEQVATGRSPLHSEIDYVGPSQHVRRVEHALFPLSSDGTTVDIIWVVVDIERRR